MLDARSVDRAGLGLGRDWAGLGRYTGPRPAHDTARGRGATYDAGRRTPESPLVVGQDPRKDAPQASDASRALMSAHAQDVDLGAGPD